MSQQTSGEKTEEPTPKKLRDSRQKGQVAKSQEVTTTISLMGVVGFLWLYADSIIERLGIIISEISKIDGDDFLPVATKGIDLVFNFSTLILVPIILIVIVFGIFGNVLQFGFLFSTETAKPQLKHISPASGFKRIFSKKQLVETLKSVVKIVFMSFLLWLIFLDSLSAYIHAIRCGLSCMVVIFSSLMIKILLYSALAFVIVSVLDFIFQRHTHTKSLMMSKDEVKREYKETEGDPMIKGERKRVAQEIAMSEDGVAETKKSTALIVNPTHFSIAIKYDKEVDALPKLVAKGRNLRAYQMRMAAEASGVPVFHNPPLARGLYADVELFASVPDEFFEAIAKILHWVETHKDELYKEPLEHGVIDDL